MRVTWKLPDGAEITAEVEDGQSLMEAAVANDVPGIPGECGGNMSCATCHVYVDPDWHAKTGKVSGFEDAMLDMADADRQGTSRLSCQIRAGDALDGLVLHVPAAD